MSKKIFLHLGLHKTATTSFQATCAKNQKDLQEQGYLYPLISCDKSDVLPFANHSIPLFSLFSQSPEKYPVNIRLGLNDLDEIHKHYREQLQAAFSSINDLIISAEDIGSLEINEIQSLLEFLQETGRDVRPFAVVRDPYTYHCSQLQQQIKSGTPMQPWKHCPQRERIQKLDTVFHSDLKYINFEASCNHPHGPTAHLLESIGVNTKEIDITGRNIGRCNDNIRLQNALNYRQPQIINDQVNPNHIKIAPFPGRKYRLTTQEILRSSPHWDEPKNEATLLEHLDHECAVIEAFTGLSWSGKKTETRRDILDAPYPIATYAMVITTALVLQSMQKPRIRSLPIDEIHASLTAEGSNRLRKLQTIRKEQIEKLIEPREGVQSTTPKDELIKCGIPDEAATILLSIATTWIRRQYAGV